MADAFRQLEAYRHFAASMADQLTWVFTVDGHARGTGQQTRAVLRAMREELRRLRLAVEFPETTETAAETHTNAGGPL